ncbi:MAG: glycosyltransferase family 2 protein, partial [Parcubacteria group bacterium]|nr:glycosyltransferase family 2 protein [Parcubacteria group bacterium]
MERGCISVQVVVRNEAHRIHECLAAVRRQTYRRIEVVLWDNSSTDGTPALVERTFPQVRVVRAAENVGFGGGHNRLFPQTRGEYVLALSADVVLDENFCAEAVRCMEHDLSIGAVQGKSYRGKDRMRTDEKNIDTTGFTLFRSRRLINRGHGEIDRGAWASPEEIFSFEGAAGFFRRDALMDAYVEGELYDEDLFWYATDIDLGWRLRMLGWKSFYCPTAILYHDRPTTERLSRGLGDFIRIRKWIPLRKR